MRISKRQLKRIIREEAESHWGGGDHDYKRIDGHRAGDVGGHYKDYEGPEGGNKGDESKTHPGHTDYDSVHHKAKVAVAAIQDLASAAGVEITPSDEEEAGEIGVEGLAMEAIKRSRLKRKIRRVVREQTGRRMQLITEDEIDDELDNLHKNIGDDIEHIKDLKKDIEDDRDEEHRAELEKERKDENLKRRIRRRVQTLKRGN